MNDTRRLEALTRLVRYFILISTDAAKSGHPTSSLSAAELMTALLFGGRFRRRADEPEHPGNDRLVFSKGHATPLLYALWAAAGELDEESLRGYRRFDSALEGHPTPRFRQVDAATGSLGQGLSVGAGLALAAKRFDRSDARVFVLLGDGEMAEGSQWEALQLAAHHRLDNLVGILDVNGLGQSAETMYGRDLEAYRARVEPFGWDVVKVEDGHDVGQVSRAYARALGPRRAGKPVMIVARTVKGKGVPSIEGRNGFHGKTLDPEQLAEALRTLGPVDETLRGSFAPPRASRPRPLAPRRAPAPPPYEPGRPVATREAYGRALARLLPEFPELVVLDGDVSNSTGTGAVLRAHPERFLQMYIAEQAMAGAALGLAARGKLPFVATFAAFLTRAHDQIRMAQYSGANVKFCGSHAGVAIGPDGPSQMGLEDIALFRGLIGSTVLCPSDAVSMERLVEEAARRRGLVYLRASRNKTPVLYGPADEFPVGRGKVLRASGDDAVAVVAAGVCVHEALKAEQALREEGVRARVIDQYSVKPIDPDALRASLGPAKTVLTVEDHHLEGGLGEAVRSALADAGVLVRSLGVALMPRSGKAERLLALEGISADAIAREVRALAPGRRPRRPEGLRSRVFLDGADPAQTRELLRLMGFLDGQTTNPTLIAKNPEIRERLESGRKFRPEELLAAYRDVVTELSGLLPRGSISVEVYADRSTSADEMLRQGRRMAAWIPNAHVKFPSSKEGLEAAARAAREGLRVNMTLCFSQAQAAAAHAATAGARRGDVFVSPFVGRLDDAGADGMSLVADVERLYRDGDGHVEVLAASLRGVDHLLRAFALGADIVTAPFSVLKEWAERGMPVPEPGAAPKAPKGLEPVAPEDLRLAADWRSFDVSHPLTDKGLETFSADWNALLERPARKTAGGRPARGAARRSVRRSPRPAPSRGRRARGRRAQAAG